MSSVHNRCWDNQYRIKNGWTISGYSRAAYRTGIYINDIDTLFDAGPQCFKRPARILITHPHGDHIAELPLTLIRDKTNTDSPVDIYGSAKSETRLTAFIQAFYQVNADTDHKVDLSGTYCYHGLSKDSDAFTFVKGSTTYSVDVLECDHSITTISYAISHSVNKLKPELIGKTEEIIAMKKRGETITKTVVHKDIAFVCDTSIRVFDLNPGLLDYPIIFIECTFLDARHKQNAIDTKHIHWDDLLPIIKANPKVQFVLIHFSMQYKDDYLREFFASGDLEYLIGDRIIPWI